jgi:hypothetical protein
MATTAPPNLGLPAIATPRQLDLRNIQQSLDNIKERFRRDEAEILRLRGLLAGDKSSTDITKLQQQVAKLSQQVTALNTAPDVAELVSVLSQSNGFVIVKDGHLLTRVLVPGEGILITWPDGAGGNPVISTGNILSIAIARSEEWNFNEDVGEDWQ